MKKRFMIFSILVFAMSIICFAFASVSVAKQIKLTYSNFFPPTHIQSKLAQSWCNEVEKRTNGKVKVEYYPAGTLTKARQCYDGVVEGLSDIGFSVLAYSKGRFPVLAAVDLPLGYTSGLEATKVANAVYNRFTPKSFNDTEVMYFHAHGPGLIFTSKKPVRTIADMKGLKLRATGNSAKVVKALGGIPVAISMPDSYQSIQKGIVNGGLYPLETNKGWKMGEVVKYCTADFPAAYTTTFFVVMNKDKWQSLSQDIQKTIKAINKEWIIKHGEAWDTSDIAGLNFFLNQGNEMFGLDAKESVKWKKAVAPIIKDYVKNIDKKGLDGQKIVDFTIKTINNMK